MSILNMQRITVIALLKYCKDILETLQRRGVVEIETYQLDDDDGVFERGDTAAYQSQYLRSSAVARQAAEIIHTYVPEKKGLLSSMSGRKPLSLAQYDALVADSQDILHTAYDIVSYQKNIEQNRLEIERYEAQKTAIEPWLSLDVPMTFTGTATTRAFIGSFPPNKTREMLLSELSEQTDVADMTDIEIISSDENRTYAFLLCPIGCADALSDAIKKLGFEYPPYSAPVSVRKRIKQIDQHISNRRGRILENEANIKSVSSSLSSLDFLEDYFVMKAERYQAFDHIILSDNTFALTGYITERDAPELSRYLEDTYDAEVELSPSDTDDTPVKLMNNRFAEPVESVLATYSYPIRHETDPTAVMAIFYYIFFGMMFSDAGYGIVMAGACGLLLLKFRNMEEGLRRAMKMFFWCGVSTTMWGLLFGSFFGDAVSVISNTFFHTAPPAIPGLVTPIWFNPVSDPMRMLMFSFLLGIIHLFTGLFIQAYNDIKHKEYLAILYDVVSWYLLVGGAILALLSLEMMEGIAGFVLPSVWLKIGGVMALIGAVLILFFSGRESENPIKRLLKGAYGLYGATGYLSDILSYSRLLALGLATGVIAQVFNQIGSMMGSSVIGVILFLIIFVVGHTLNIGINALGAYVHTNRLQFVEFFGKFYTGGGREFKPFKINTKHYTVKEDI